MIFPEYEFRGTPNYSPRHYRIVSACVIHYTAGGGIDGTVRWLQNPKARVSAHFVIGRDGKIIQMVDTSMAAWHAGKAELEIESGEVVSDANYRTIGIELCNYGRLLERDGKFFYKVGKKSYQYRSTLSPIRAELKFDSGYSVESFWEPYDERQIEALKELLSKLSASGLVDTARTVGHESIGMPLGRKTDPGPLFPWNEIPHAQQRTTLEFS